MLKIDRIEHIGVAVENMEVAKDFYENILGLTALIDVKVAQQKQHLCLFPIGECGLELVAPLAPEAAVNTVLAERGAGPYHIALKVSDIRETLLELSHMNIHMKDKVCRAGGCGGEIAFSEAQATAGNIVFEFCEREL